MSNVLTLAKRWYILLGNRLLPCRIQVLKITIYSCNTYQIVCQIEYAFALLLNLLTLGDVNYGIEKILLLLTSAGN